MREMLARVSGPDVYAIAKGRRQLSTLPSAETMSLQTCDCWLSQRRSSFLLTTSHKTDTVVLVRVRSTANIGQPAPVRGKCNWRIILSNSVQADAPPCRWATSQQVDPHLPTGPCPTPRTPGALPSGENLTDHTSDSWPLRLRGARLVPCYPRREGRIAGSEVFRVLNQGNAPARPARGPGRPTTDLGPNRPRGPGEQPLAFRGRVAISHSRTSPAPAARRGDSCRPGAKPQEVCSC